MDIVAGQESADIATDQELMDAAAEQSLMDVVHDRGFMDVIAQRALTGLIQCREEIDIHVAIPENPDYHIYADSRIQNVKSGHFLTSIINNGYRCIKIPIMVDGIRYNKHFTVSILVARAFVYNDNPKHRIYVDHKDRNKLNNCYTNLRWATASENRKNSSPVYNTCPVAQYDINDKFVTRFNSLTEAMLKIGTGKTSISACINGRHKTAFARDGKQYKWKRLHEAENIPLPADAKPICNYLKYHSTPEGQIYSEYIKRFMKCKSDGTYFYVKLSKNGKKERFAVHRTILETFIENKPLNYQTLFVDHIDGNIYIIIVLVILNM
jgi:HNH endonuclease/NUMOD1 domain